MTAETNPAVITTNPHSQILTVTIRARPRRRPLRSSRCGSLISRCFATARLIAWFGIMVVVENVVSSLFNSHLFDFSEGWLYVFGVGVIGGMMLRAADAAAKAEEKT